MEHIKITNKIGSFEASYGNGNILLGYSGFSAAEVIPAIATGYGQHGSTMEGVYLGTRPMNIDFLIYGGTMAEIYKKKAEVSKILNPLAGECVLTYTNDHLSRSITAYITRMPAPTTRYGLAEAYSVELIAYNPFWYDVAENGLLLGDFTGGLRFPLRFMGNGVRFANKGAAANIVINGDIPSPIRAEFKNTAVNPTLTLETTGEHIEVITSIEDGEKLTVHTEYGNKTVIKTDSTGIETSAYHLISIDSKFFSLQPGANRLSFEGDAGTPEVYIYWRNYFMGV